MSVNWSWNFLSEMFNKLWVICQFCCCCSFFKRLPSWLHLDWLTFYLALRSQMVILVGASNSLLCKFGAVLSLIERQWLCPWNGVKGHVGPSDWVARSRAGSKYALEVRQQLQLNCCLRIWDFPFPARGNSVTLDFFIKSLFLLLMEWVGLSGHSSEMFQHNIFWMRWSSLLLGMIFLGKTVHVQYTFQVPDAGLVP